MKIQDLNKIDVFDLQENERKEFEKVQKIVKDLTDFVNSFSLDKNQFFILAMSREHRTLQQSFSRLVFSWLEFCASEYYRTDARNEATKKIASEMIEKFKASNYNYLPSECLPFI